jgi:two-component system, LytTR family, sensor kinase
VAREHLQVKTNCEKCAAALHADGLAYICSYECTFCSACAISTHRSCPNCGGELVRRPRRAAWVAVQENAPAQAGSGSRPWLIWVISFGVWTIVALAATGSVYGLYRSRGLPMAFATILSLELCQILAYAPLTPIAFALALRFPIQRGNWLRRSSLHLLFALVFSLAHTAFRFVTPFAAWDPKVGGFVSGIWNSQTHLLEIKWQIFRNLFLTNIVDDITGTYVPIVLVAHALSYYWRFRDRELHSAKLQMQIAKSRLQALKSHLQPHFLFNTMHSISALMLTDVRTADKMMSRLSDLLRLSLENSEIQTTRLSRELEFAGSYLEIEKLRFEDRLNIVLDIAPETLDAQVPSLLLQPLVENAVRHGISKLSAGGQISIAANRDGNDLHLRVRDNGPGLTTAADATSSTGLGIRTTRERLRTLYGDNQRLDTQDVPNGGVEVSVKIPFQIEPQSPPEGDPVFARTTNAD